MQNATLMWLDATVWTKISFLFCWQCLRGCTVDNVLHSFLVYRRTMLTTIVVILRVIIESVDLNIFSVFFWKCCPMGVMLLVKLIRLLLSRIIVIRVILWVGLQDEQKLFLSSHMVELTLRIWHAVTTTDLFHQLQNTATSIFKWTLSNKKRYRRNKNKS